MEMLFYAHSGLRYLVLLSGIVALVYFGYAAATKRPNEKIGRILGSSFAGLLSLQMLLGILIVAFGLFYPALMGHIFMMLIAVAVAHIAMKMGRTNEARGNAIRFAGVLVSLLLVVAGIMSIGREVFGSGSPTLIQ